MKRPEYVAVVVDAYRRAIDSYLGGDYQVPEEDFANIEQIFNRDFTNAYLLERPGREMMSDRRPNNRGVLVGRVVKLDKAANKATLKLDKELHLDDGLEFLGQRGWSCWHYCDVTFAERTGSSCGCRRFSGHYRCAAWH